MNMEAPGRQKAPGGQKALRASSSFLWPLGTRMVRGSGAGQLPAGRGGRLDSINSSCLPFLKSNNYEQHLAHLLRRRGT